MSDPRPAVVLRLSLAEHDWLSDCEEAEDATARYLERIAAATWETIAGDERVWLDPNLDSVGALCDALKEDWMEEVQQPAEVVEALRARIERVIEERGPLSSAGYITFEGHHNDTELFVAFGET